MPNASYDIDLSNLNLMDNKFLSFSDGIRLNMRKKKRLVKRNPLVKKAKKVKPTIIRPITTSLPKENNDFYGFVGIDVKKENKKKKNIYIATSILLVLGIGFGIYNFQKNQL